MTCLRILSMEKYALNKVWLDTGEHLGKMICSKCACGSSSQILH